MAYRRIDKRSMGWGLLVGFVAAEVLDERFNVVRQAMAWIKGVR